MKLIMEKNFLKKRNKTFLQEVSHKWTEYILVGIMGFVAAIGAVQLISIYEFILTMLATLVVFMFNDKRLSELKAKRMAIANKYLKVKINEIKKGKIRKGRRARKKN